MKKEFIVIVFVLFTILSRAQQATTVTVRRSFRINRNTVVRDSAGKPYPYDEWRPLMATGEYVFRPDYDRDSTVYLLIKRSSLKYYLKHQPNSEGQHPAIGANASMTEEQRIAILPKPMESPFFKTGTTIPSIVVRDIDGNKFKLKDLKGKVVVLNFWFIGCPPCRQEMPELNKLVASYSNDPDVVFIAIGLNQRWEIRDFIKNQPYNYHLVDDGRMYASVYGINLYPTHVILDKNGIVAFHSVSFASNTPYWMRKTIDEARKGTPTAANKQLQNKKSVP